MRRRLFIFVLLSLLKMQVSPAGAGENPFTPRAALIRYWNNQISNNEPKPAFLISKASPLTAVDASAFAKLAAKGTLANHLRSFCAAADLLCFPDLGASLEKHDEDSNFAVYRDKNFTNYGSSRLGGLDSFKNYSDGENLPVNDFRRYSRNAAGHNDKFDSYGRDTNVVDQGFNSYGSGATGGKGEFRNYNNDANVPDLKFNNYAAEGNGRSHSFTEYADANAGSVGFTSYGRNANGAPNEFTNYAPEANVIGSGFSNYGEGANGANNSFTNYGNDGNVPENTFNSYGDGGNSAVNSFVNYRDKSNVGDDSFESYAKNSNTAEVNFLNYGKSFNEGTDKFSGYGQGAKGQAVSFKVYGVNNTFKDYAKKKTVSFSSYTTRAEAAAAMKVSGSIVNKWVEPGKFFRESKLKKGTLLPMPDIKDKMPKRSFLPRSVSSKLPFATSKLSEMKQIFHAGDNSSTAAMMTDALSECERAPSAGETKRCVSSIEDMIDFATSVLGRNVVVRSTESVVGSKQQILIGEVRGINGGKLTKAVSCHQSLYPYLLYYCHSVPTVRVYEADILDPKSKSRINHGVAICHLDTSAWSPTHGAFLALGFGPGKVEVCHWIFENDMNWTTSD